MVWYPYMSPLKTKAATTASVGRPAGPRTGCVGLCRGSRAVGRHGQAGLGECPLTPSEEAELEEVVLDVDVVDLDEEEEEVEGLGGHPRQGTEKAGMQQGSSDLAEPLSASGQRHAQQEAAVEQEQRGQEVHVDPGRVVPQPLPARGGRAGGAGGCPPDSTALHGTVWHGIVKHSMAQHDMAWHSPTWYAWHGRAGHSPM